MAISIIVLLSCLGFVLQVAKEDLFFRLEKEKGKDKALFRDSYLISVFEFVARRSDNFFSFINTVLVIFDKFIHVSV